MLKVINHEFLYHNAVRAYPFAEDASRVSSIGEHEVRIPDDFLLGCKLSLAASPEQVNPANFYVSRLSVYPHGSTITISYQDADESIVEAAVVLVVFDSNDDCFQVLEIIPTNSFYNLTGHITVGTGKNLLNNPGEYLFTLDATRFDLDCIDYLPKCVTSLTVETGNETSSPIYGDIVLAAGNNVELAISKEGATTVITVNAQFEYEAQSGILTINHVGPDSDGNIDIVSKTECLQIEAETGLIEITNNCSSPCCGCDELKQITTNHEILTSKLNAIEAFEQYLQSSLTALHNSLGMSGI
jgi:hypothetical protein